MLLSRYLISARAVATQRLQPSHAYRQRLFVLSALLPRHQPDCSSTVPLSSMPKLASQRSSVARCSGRPFVEAKTDPPRPLRTVADRWTKRLKYTLISLPIWTGVSLLLLVNFIRNPAKFLAKKDRRGIHYGDPFPGLEHQMVEANGIRFHTVAAGRAPGKKLMLLVHGFPELWYSWRWQLEAFTDEYEVVAFDLRGYGQTEKPKGIEHYTIDKLADDIACLVKALGYDSCTLVAHDWGGVISWLAAHTHSSLIDKLIIMCAPHPKCMYDWDQYKRSWYILAFQAPILPELLLLSNDCEALDASARTGPSAMKTDGTITVQEVERYKQAFQQIYAATAALNFYRAYMQNVTTNPSPGYLRMVQDPEKLQIPTLVVWGADDAALGPQLAHQTPQFVEDVEVHILKNCSHWAQQDRPSEVNSIMRNFLRKPLHRPQSTARQQQSSVST